MYYEHKQNEITALTGMLLDATYRINNYSIIGENHVIKNVRNQKIAC